MTPKSPPNTHRLPRQRPAGEPDRTDATAAKLEQRSAAQYDSPYRADRAPGGMDGKSAGWLLLLPLVCCGGPLLIAAAASAGAIGWGALGAGVAALIAAVGLVVVRRRRAPARCCDPAAADHVGEVSPPELRARSAGR